MSNFKVPGKGKLLISAPMLGDIFKRSVILLTEHNEDGSVGFILNKPTDLKLNEIIEDFPEFDAKIYLGGPVQRDSLNFISRKNYFEDDSYEISEGLYWNGNFEKLKILIETGSIDPDDIKFYLGYSGWGPGQLDNEMKIKSWYVNTPTSEMIFDEEDSKLWSTVLKSMGNEFTVISTFPDDPSVN
ncbi:MAG TPA: YqgE/AlgH family protein [Ignavibacteria bacterium]|nr:YqgE/AlgH family protein [Ignavibacteria bacterium]